MNTNMDIDRIDKHTKIEDVTEILRMHGIDNTEFTTLVLGLMTMNCEYIEVIGFGSEARIKQNG